MLARAIHEQRPLASLLGVPASSLEAARALARWAQAVGEPGLALAAWEGTAALDDACVSWLGVAAVALSLGDAQRAFHAAARVSAHAAASPADRAGAALLCARACLLADRHEDARRWLGTVAEDADPEVARLARAIATALHARERAPAREER